MVVYSKFSKPYKLASRPAAKMSDGSIYDVVGEPGIQVKVLDKAYRTDEMERSVEDSVGGMGMLDVSPIEPVYQNNRFAGFVMEKPAVQEFDPVPAPAPVPSSAPIRENAVVTDSGPVPLLVMIVAGIIMTAALILAIFPALSASMDYNVRTVMFSGIPMAAIGWVLLLFVAAKSNGVDWKYAVLGILAYVVGAVLCYILISNIVYLFFAAKALAIALLPSIIGVAVVIMIVKSMIGR